MQVRTSKRAARMPVMLAARTVIAGDKLRGGVLDANLVRATGLICSVKLAAVRVTTLADGVARHAGRIDKGLLSLRFEGEHVGTVRLRPISPSPSSPIRARAAVPHCAETKRPPLLKTE